MEKCKREILLEQLVKMVMTLELIEGSENDDGKVDWHRRRRLANKRSWLAVYDECRARRTLRDVAKDQ